MTGNTSESFRAKVASVTDSRRLWTFNRACDGVPFANPSRHLCAATFPIKA